MRATFTDTIEVKITLDTDDMKSICDNIAIAYPRESKDDFFDRALVNILNNYFDDYTWYINMVVREVKEMCPTIVEKIIEYVNWYIINYYLPEPEDFKWSD
jgi:hypothetical protein